MSIDLFGMQAKEMCAEDALGVLHEGLEAGLCEW